MAKDSTEDGLREAGWMTIDEFLEKFNYGLKDYLSNKVYGTGQEDKLHHPTDLSVHTALYADIMFSVIENFGVAPCEASES
jgi:hypothetical protein